MSTDTDREVWLPLTEAAPQLGLSRHQLRRRIRAGQITNRQVQGPHGLTYEVCLDPDATVSSGLRHPDDRNGDTTVTVTPPLAELVSLVRDTQTQLLKATAAAERRKEKTYGRRRARARTRTTLDPALAGHQ